MTVAYLNGEFLPLTEARISPMDRGFLFGDGVYEVIPVYQGKLFRAAQHLQRLAQSLAAIHLSVSMADDDWERVFAELIKRNGGGNQLIYLQCTRGPMAVREHLVPAETIPTIFAYSYPLVTKSIAELSQGITAITLQDIRWLHCDIKAITLLPNVLLRQQAMNAGVQEAILIRDGLAIESTAANLFIVKSGTIITPPRSNKILGGITRDVVLELATAQHFPVQEASIPVAMLHDADEIWLTSSSREITPVIQLDGKPVGDGKAGIVWQRMIQYYQDFK